MECFFTTISQILSKSIPKSKTKFKNLLYNSSLNSFLLERVTHNEVRKLVSQVNKWEPLGPTSISFTILKDYIDALARPLTLILNESFEQGIFPKILKLAEVSFSQRIHCYCFSNYNPISLLYVFSKIFKKAMYPRTYSFLFKYKLIESS